MDGGAGHRLGARESSGHRGTAAAMPMARRSGFQRKREERASAGACVSCAHRCFRSRGPGRVARPRLATTRGRRAPFVSKLLRTLKNGAADVTAESSARDHQSRANRLIGRPTEEKETRPDRMIVRSICSCSVHTTITSSILPCPSRNRLTQCVYYYCLL